MSKKGGQKLSKTSKRGIHQFNKRTILLREGIYTIEWVVNCKDLGQKLVDWNTC